MPMRESQWDRNDFARLSKLFERQIFIDSNPSIRHAACCGVLLLSMSSQPGLALERLDQAILADPMGLRHYIAKVQLLGRMGRPEQGIQVLESLPRWLAE